MARGIAVNDDRLAIVRRGFVRCNVCRSYNAKQKCRVSNRLCGSNREKRGGNSLGFLGPSLENGGCVRERGSNGVASNRPHGPHR